MGKKRSAISLIVIFFGALLFFGGFYLLPIGTDAYMYFWIEIVAKGNWLTGDILANGVALAMMLIGGLMLYHEHKSPWPKDKKEKSKESKRVSLFGKKKKATPTPPKPRWLK